MVDYKTKRYIIDSYPAKKISEIASETNLSSTQVRYYINKDKVEMDVKTYLEMYPKATLYEVIEATGKHKSTVLKYAPHLKPTKKKEKIQDYARKHKTASIWDIMKELNTTLDYTRKQLNSPCKNCEERHTNCHTDCEDYIIYKLRFNAAKNKHEKQKIINNYTYDKINNLSRFRKS